MKVSPRQLEQLIQDLEDGCLSASDHERLLEVLSTDGEARRRYCEHMAFSSAMNTKAEAEADLETWTPDELKEPTDSGLFAKSLVAAAAVLLISAAVAAVVTLNRQVILQADLEAPAGTAWSLVGRGGEDMESGTRILEGSTVVVRSGLLSFTLDTGARMVVQGPARVKFSRFQNPVVEEGWLWIDTAEGSQQFSVEAGGIQFKDIGTRFGVRVRSDGRPELHVVEGKVSARNLATGKTTTVPAGNNAFRFLTSGRLETLRRGVDPFLNLRALLDGPKHYATTLQSQSPVGYWRMDARKGDSVLNSVPGGSVGERGLYVGLQGVEFGVGSLGPAEGFAGFGEGNKGARFEGAGNPSSAIINLDCPEGVSTEAGAVSFWIHREPGMIEPEVLWFAGDEDADGFGPEPEINVSLAESGRVQFFIEAGENDVILSSPRASADGRWHHIVATWSEEFVGLHIDGELVARDTEQRKKFQRKFYGREVRFGKVGWFAPINSSRLRLFEGEVDEIALWNRGLTEEEVVSQYRAGLGE